MGAISRRVDQALKYVRGSQVLDVGCAGAPDAGSFYWLHGQLRKKFQHVVGIDINERHIEQIRAMGFRETYVCCAESFSLAQRFDTIVAGELVEHLSNPGLFLERCKEHLAVNGRVIITTPNPFSLSSILYAIFKFPRTCANSEHTCWFCPRTFQELAGRVGFRTIHWELIEDYRIDEPALLYSAFVRFISAFSWLIPKRLSCNTMLFILEPEP